MQIERRMYRPERKEMTESWREVHVEELDDPYFASDQGG